MWTSIVGGMAIKRLVLLSENIRITIFLRRSLESIAKIKNECHTSSSKPSDRMMRKKIKYESYSDTYGS